MRFTKHALPSNLESQSYSSIGDNDNTMPTPRSEKSDEPELLSGRGLSDITKVAISNLYETSALSFRLNDDVSLSLAMMNDKKWSPYFCQRSASEMEFVNRKK